MRKTPASTLSQGIPQQGQMASADLLPGVSGPVRLRRKRWQLDDATSVAIFNFSKGGGTFCSCELFIFCALRLAVIMKNDRHPI